MKKMSQEANSQQLLLPFDEYSDNIEVYNCSHIVQFVKENMAWKYHGSRRLVSVMFRDIYYYGRTPHELVNNILKDIL